MANSTTLSTLVTRLQDRLGLGAVSSTEETCLTEAVQAGLQRALVDGIPGLSHEVFTAWTPQDITFDSSGATKIGANSVGNAGATTIKIENASTGDTSAAWDFRSDTMGVLPQDIVKYVSSGGTRQYLVREVTGFTEGVASPAAEAYNTIDVGAPLVDATGAAAAGTKIVRRGIRLPTSGQVIAVYQVNSAGKTTRLQYSPLHAMDDPFKQGATAQFFEQRWDRTGEEGSSSSSYTARSYVSIWPAPATSANQYDGAGQFKIVQARQAPKFASTAILPYPEEVLDAIMERARLAYLTWSGNINQVDAAMATESVRDISDAFRNSSTAEQVFIKQ